jgi:predicted CoA-binding protein
MLIVALYLFSKKDIKFQHMPASPKKTLVLGASANPQRYSYMAIHRLRGHNHPTVAIGKRKGIVGDTEIAVEQKAEEGVDTVTLYLSAANQKPYYDYILSLHPKRIIFNPGAENDELYDLATKNGIQPMEACTLVMLSTGQY